jgi:HJR/Mrr/RecB family endonuclease
MNNHSPGNVDLWFVTEDDVRNAANGIPFEPNYSIYAYFWLRRRLDENTLEGWIGRIDKMENFHCTIDTTYEYFKEYRAQKKIYVTLDKTVFFEIDEIFPSKPLLFLLKRIKHQPDAKPTTRTVITATVHRLQFHLLGGDAFEHLVFAFLQQTATWKSIEWLGEAGQDNGKDIWAEKDNATYCFQCANYQLLTANKVIADMDKLFQHRTIPDNLIIVCGGKATDGLRQKAISYGLLKGFGSVTIWSGPELEEKIRKQAPEILLRFFEGHAFPETRSVV